MPKQQKRQKFDCLHTSVLQQAKSNVCQKARQKAFDYLTGFVKRLFYAVLTFDYFLVKALCLGATNSPTDRPANLYKLRDNSEITRR